MPLLVRLTDSQVDAIDNMVSQVSDGVDDDGRVLEEVGPVGLAIDEKPLSPDLYVKPVHRNAQFRSHVRGAEKRAIRGPSGCAGCSP